MNARLERATSLVGEPNLQAFLHVLGGGETHDALSEEDYRLVHRDKSLIAEWRHPFYGVPCPPGTPTTACGAFGFLGTTFAAIDTRLGLGGDFSPASQRVAAVDLIDEKGAIVDVLSGNLVSACSKLAGVWVSLQTMSLQRAQAIFLHYGGSYNQSPAPAESPPPGIYPTMPTDTPTGVSSAPAGAPTQGASMLPLLISPLLISPLLSLIPELIGALGHGDRAQQNAKTAGTVLDAFVKAVPGAVNAQDAIEKAQADPTVLQAAKVAVMADPTVVALMEVGGGVVKAREQNIALVQAADKWWKLVFNPVLLVTAALLPLVYMITWGLMPFLSKVSSDVIAQTIGTIIGLVLGSVCGFWMGQTFQQQRQRSTDQVSPS